MNYEQRAAAFLQVCPHMLHNAPRSEHMKSKETHRTCLSKLKFPNDYNFIYNMYNLHCDRNITKTAHYFAISRKRVANAIAWKTEPESFERKKVGRKRILKDEHIEFINIVTEASPRTYNAKMAQMLQDDFQDISKISKWTVSRARLEAKFRYRAAKKACSMKQVSKDHRVGWCLNHLENGANFENVVFSDESWFEFGPDNRWLWVRPNDYRPEVCVARQKHPAKVMVWGAIGKNFKSQIIFWKGNVNKENYIPTLQEHNFFADADAHFGKGKWIFQQDNATPHKAKDTLNKFAELGISLLEDWPPNSPDLNIIENIWAIMKMRLQAKQVSTIKELEQEISEVWDNLSFQTINKLVDSIPARMKLVVEKRGETIFLNELT